MKMRLPLPFLPVADSAAPNYTPKPPAKIKCTSRQSSLVMKVMVYPRPKIKATLVAASRKAGLSLSSFIIRAGLEQAAAIKKHKVTDLISAEEFAQYV